MLEIGDPAPDFMAESTEGKIHLYDYKGKKNVVLIFYPINNTPGCRKQLCEARDHLVDYADLDTVVLGINPGKFKGHQKFTDEHHFGFPLIFDENWRIVYDFKVPTMFALMQARTVYVLDKQMKVRYSYKGHPPQEEVFRVLRELAGKSTP